MCGGDWRVRKCWVTFQLAVGIPICVSVNTQCTLHVKPYVIRLVFARGCLVFSVFGSRFIHAAADVYIHRQQDSLNSW